TRNNLNTVEHNTFAQFNLIPDYEKIGSYISSGTNKYVVLMSFGYRTDKVILENLLSHNFRYLGMMGSKEKTKTLFKELINEGVNQQDLNRVHAPIGIQISSKTPLEIAVSIMAQVTLVKNEA
ncbi:MAG: XdhC family protein, partial [Flavobacteriales bacterium]|nr:XdhC family protein [Flavobacteriales bacterium]